MKQTFKVRVDMPDYELNAVEVCGTFIRAPNTKVWNIEKIVTTVASDITYATQDPHWIEDLEIACARAIDADTEYDD